MLALLTGVVAVRSGNRDEAKTAARLPDRPPGAGDALPQPLVPPLPADTSATPEDQRRAAAWVQAVGGSLLVLDADDRPSRIGPDDPLPSGDWQVWQVVLDGGNKPLIDDESIQVLGSLPRLEELLLRGAPLTDEGLGFLDRLTALRRLDLQFVPISDAVAPRISRLHRLENLQLGETRVGDTGFAIICDRLAGLKRLSLGPAMTDAGVVAAARLPALESLGMKRQHGSERAFTALAGCPPLRSLQIVAAQDLQVRRCATLLQVERLVLNYLEASPAAFESLRSMERLRDLNVGDSPLFTAEHLREVQGIPGLRQLTVRREAVGDEALAGFRAARPDVEVVVTE